MLECQELKGVSIPSSLATINSNPFTDRPKLGKIEVSEDNPGYIIEYGVLFNKEKTFLISCPQTKSEDYKVPAGVKEIGEEAFGGCTELTSVALPVLLPKLGYLILRIALISGLLSFQTI